MDSDASTLFGAILLAFLLIINFIMTAFLAAIRSISDSVSGGSICGAGASAGSGLRAEGSSGAADTHHRLAAHRRRRTRWPVILSHVHRGSIRFMAIFPVLAVFFHLFGNLHSGRCSAIKTPPAGCCTALVLPMQSMTVLFPFTGPY